MMKQNIILRGIGGFYDVLTTDDQVIRCKLRGKLRLDDDKVYVGDWVELSLVTKEEGVIDRILPRKNSLTRPAIANLDQAVVVLAWVDPKPNWLFLDRLLVSIQAAGMRPVICLNKSDLSDPDHQDWQKIKLYEQLGYDLVITSLVDQQGIEKLRDLLTGKVSTFAGQSGVGKSTILNRLETGLDLPVGAVSSRLKRGKHTTRQVELIQLSSGGLVADTPGFSQMTLGEIKSPQLQEYFPEIWQAAENCQFRSCIHHREPNCGVVELVKSSDIHQFRYDNYLTLFAELREGEEY